MRLREADRQQREHRTGELHHNEDRAIGQRDAGEGARQCAGDRHRRIGERVDDVNQ